MDEEVKIPRLNSMVVFDRGDMSDEDYDEYYREKFHGKLFVFLGPIAQTTVHCILADLDTGKIIGMYHTDNFREATDEEF